MGPICITQVLTEGDCFPAMIRGRREVQNDGARDAVLPVWKGPRAKECGLPLEAGKDKDTEPPERNAALATPGF